MKKQIAKISTLLCMLALVLAVILSLCACESGVTYTYSKANVEMGAGIGGTGSMSAVYDAMYKDSTITVTDSKIVWKISDMESVMSVSKEGEKYMLSGEYVEQMKKTLSQGFANVSSYEFYGIETENGFDIVMSMTATVGIPGATSSSFNINYSFSFVK
ncbi:MAG: hypothetical protein K2L42_05765 [Clostridia bacterium]|nr:hypothetical protein [Clostridia bacterium]